ncbi:hypothetical protein [Subdoligranulum variabile]|uniref:hypothetical protein n=1 Tax=Subdoligranulum variabile TaxID=214851 RepID=UPI0026F32633|nr:hypothetical protein [Subdoligranulum variabile]
MNEMQQLSLTPDGTPEQAQAMGLHYEIMAAAQAAANSLLDLGRKLKQMRDTGGYKRLGFETFADYTEQAVGIRQRQAYNYISVVENVPARLVEENAAAGVTKLALLAKLGPADQQEVAGQDLANITVAELKKLVEERNGLSEQLSMIQDTARPAAEAESYEVDMEALRAQALEQARAEVKEQHAQAMRKALQEQGEKLAADRKAAEAHAAEQAKKEAERKARKQVAQAKAEAAQAAEKKLAEEREAARRDQEEKDRAALEAARQEAEAARTQAEEIARKLQLAASEESIRFALLFEQLQGAAGAMMDLVDDLTAAGRAEESDKLRTALTGALQALAEQVAV